MNQNEQNAHAPIEMQNLQNTADGQNLQTESVPVQSDSNLKGDMPQQNNDLEIGCQENEEGQEFEAEEEELARKIENVDPEQEIKKKLMFDLKEISVPKLYCHLANTFEKVLMVIGTIGALGAGIAGPLMAYLFGGTLNDVSVNGNEENYGNISDSLMKTMMRAYKPTMEDMVHKFLYIGTGMFVAEALNGGCWHLATLRMIHNMKERYFALILKQEQGWFDATNAFEFSTKVQAQLEQVEMGLGEKLATIIQMCSQLIAGLIVGFTTSWKLTLIMLCVGPFVLIFVIYLVTSLKKFIVLARKTYEVAGGIAEELLYNIKTVASFVNFDFEQQRFGRYVDKVDYYEKKLALRLSGSVCGMIFFLNFSFSMAILVSQKFIRDGEINSNSGEKFNGGDCLTVIMSTVMAIMSVSAIGPNIKTIQEACTASSDYFTLVERKPEIDLSGTYKPPRDQVNGKIEFRNIKFIYPSDPKKRVILNNLNILVEPGKKVALVGESGCGKSTTVNLIERLYEPVEGQVLIDDVEISKYDLKYLRTLIGYVQQEPVLFNRPIRENLIFGREKMIKELGDVDQLIDKACAESYAKEFIDNLPDKYNYPVGIKGSKLSGGQKQRIAIARAILCEPKILILDEATSALDTKSEKEVQRALDNISKKNVSTVIIAHRLSTIKNADLIYAIKDGHVIEQGTHKELLEKNGYYAGLVRSQLAEDELQSKEENYDAMSKKKSTLSHLSRMTNKKMSYQYNNSDKAGEIANPEAKLAQISSKSKGIRRGELFKYIPQHKLEISVGTISSLILGGLVPASGVLLARAFNALTGPVKDMKDDAIFYSCMYIVYAAANALFTFLKMLTFVRIGSSLTTAIRKVVLKKYLDLHIAYFDVEENAPGGLLTRLSLDTIQLRSLILSVIGDVVAVIGVIVVGCVLSFRKDWKLTLINIAFIPFMIVARICVAKSKRSGRLEDKKINIEAGAVLSECVINTKTIYSFNFQKAAVEMYLDILSAQKKVFVRDSLVRGLLGGVGVFCVYASCATVFHYAYQFICDGSLNYNDMNETMNVVMMLSNGISQNIIGLSDYTKAACAFNSVFATLDTKSLIDVSKEVQSTKRSAKDVQGKIEFKNVSFAYPTKPDTIVLKNVSFTIEKGQAAALCGYSGSGKSSIIQLLERYYDVTEGEILIDGVNIKDYNLLELRKKIGLVSQEPVLFKRSVYQNIRYGNLNASRKEVFEAAKDAAIEKFFNKKEMGTKEDPVSGGEKQRLCIARAFLKNPTIMLLDEATSALDKESELMVQESIDKLLKGRTSVTVAHRLSTIENSDIIFVLEAGRIVEKGTHEELIKLGKKYYTLYKYSCA